MTVNARTLNRGIQKVVTEIAQTLAKGNAALVELNQQGLALNQYHTQIQFSISVGDSYFVNIAKIRALKVGWQQILAAWKITSPAIPNIEAHLTTATQTDNENYNKIKATTQAMAAVIGGANRLYIYLDRVVDPAAGSYYIENLTNQLAEAAWKEFQSLV